MSNSKQYSLKSGEVKGGHELGAKFWRGILMEAVTNFAMNVLDQEVEALKEGLKIQRWGSQGGYIRVLGGRVEIEKPRVRDQGSEVVLDSYKKLQGKQGWTNQLTQIVLGGLAERQFDRLGEVLGGHYGLSKSQVSRGVVQGLRAYYEKLMGRDCADVVGLMIDGIHFGKDGEYVVIGALGITAKGEKKLLGIWGGGTENSEVVRSLLDHLITRGLPQPQLVVLDGSKALKKALQAKWEHLVMARCQEHKKRNVLAHLPEREQAWGKEQYQGVVKAVSYEEGERKAQVFARALQKINLSAYQSLMEGLPEILVPLLIEDPNLRKFFSTTNPLESLFSMLRGKCARVKRWRNMNSVMNWIATAYYQQEKNLRKARGYRSLWELKELPRRLKEIQSQKESVKKGGLTQALPSLPLPTKNGT